jgi:alpha-beta hydrolase superfamily lysophospholipase
VRAKQPGKPVILFGHSMGGAIATSYTLFRKPQLAGLVLSGAALRADAGGGTKAIVRMTGVLFPHAGVFSLDIEKFSRDPAVVAACKADPQVYREAAPARTARALINAIDDIREHEAELTVPVLALHGSLDEVTPPDGSETLIATAKSADKTFKKYPGLVHDLVHEPEHDAVIADIVAWAAAHAK